MYRRQYNRADDSTLYMESDGNAGFRFGSKTVNGGGATLDEPAKTLSILLMGIRNTWKIDEEPNDQEERKLSGFNYRSQ